MTHTNNRSALKENWLIAFIATAMAFLEVMDMTITSVSLQQMRGALSATATQISWTMSTYIICAAIITPLSGFLILRFGRRKLMLLCILGFSISSALCGISTSFISLLILRGIQGLFGAPLAPIAQSIMAETFQGEERNKAMALFSMGIMSAPLFGPIIGGYFNDSLSWRFSFFINIPICIVIFMLALNLIRETPTKIFPIDWQGLLFIVAGIFGIQFVLEQGNFYDWYHSLLIFSSTIIGISCIVLFIIHSLGKENTIIPLPLFFDKNFAFSLIFGVLFSAGFFGVISILPMQLESINGYPAASVGWLLAPRGVTSISCMILMPSLMKKFKAHYLVMTGFLLFALGSYLLSQQSYIAVSKTQIIFATMLQGMSTAFFFVPLSVIAYRTLARENLAQASGVFNFARSLGGSLGISLSNMLQERFFQENWNHFISHLLPTNYALMKWLTQQKILLAPSSATLGNIQAAVFQRTSTMAYANTYLILSFIFILGFILVGWMNFFDKTGNNS
jgi:DHA2 family multidrug resistance protein